MLRCASPFVIAAYVTVRLIPQDSRALPADFLRSRPKFKTFATFYESIFLFGDFRRLSGWTFVRSFQSGGRDILQRPYSDDLVEFGCVQDLLYQERRCDSVEDIDTIRQDLLGGLIACPDDQRY